MNVNYFHKTQKIKKMYGILSTTTEYGRSMASRVYLESFSEKPEGTEVGWYDLGSEPVKHAQQFLIFKQKDSHSFVPYEHD